MNRLSAAILALAFFAVSQIVIAQPVNPPGPQPTSCTGGQSITGYSTYGALLTCGGTGTTTVNAASSPAIAQYQGASSTTLGGATVSGDATLASGGALTLATVNSNVGSFTNANITVNAKGLITAAANGSSAGTPGGTAGAIQYNNSGSFGGAVLTGLVLGNGASAPTAYGGTSCTNQFPTVLSAAGVATCTSVGTAFLSASAVTYAKIQNETASTLLGNPTGSAAAPSEITLGTNLSFSGSVLNATGGSSTGSGVSGGQSPAGVNASNQNPLSGSSFFYFTNSAASGAFTWTLAASATQPQGELLISDVQQTLTATNTMTITTGGTDKLNGVTNGSIILYVPGSGVMIHNDHAGNYTVDGGLTTPPLPNGDIYVGNSNGLPAAVAPGTGVVTALEDNANATGGFVTSPVAQVNISAATLPTPGSGATLVAPRSYYVCTTTCTVTIPVPAAGDEFCVMNDDNVSTVITLAALGSSARYENTARTAYGTAGTGTFVSGGAAADKVCIVGRDSTHYLTTSFNGTWTAN